MRKARTNVLRHGLKVCLLNAVDWLSHSLSGSHVSCQFKQLGNKIVLFVSKDSDSDTISIHSIAWKPSRPDECIVDAQLTGAIEIVAFQTFRSVLASQ